MSTETEKFVIDQVEWNDLSTEEIITGKAWRGQSVRAGIHAATVKCKSCGHIWRATQGNKRGDILPVNGERT